MCQEWLTVILDELDILYYESGAYYDTDYTDFVEREVAAIEKQYQLSVVEL